MRIVVFADKKIDCTQNPPLFNDEIKKYVENYGLIKNTIISPNFCVAYAGQTADYN